jgi:MerR family transcriptional regulator, heat shock protein HspR
MTGQQPDRRALYGMAVAVELTGVNPQNLRAYEAKGLLEPHRTPGGTRRYSDHDLARVERITRLLEAGLNLKGIEHVLVLEAETERLRRELATLRPKGEDGGPPAPRRRRHGSDRA